MTRVSEPVVKRRWRQLDWLKRLSLPWRTVRARLCMRLTSGSKPRRRWVEMVSFSLIAFTVFGRGSELSVFSCLSLTSVRDRQWLFHQLLMNRFETSYNLNKSMWLSIVCIGIRWGPSVVELHNVVAATSDSVRFCRGKLWGDFSCREMLFIASNLLPSFSHTIWS